MKPRRRVLFVCHGHPSARPGGAENYALELHEAMRAANGEFDSLLMAHKAPASANQSPQVAQLPGADPNQFFFISDVARYDLFTGRCRDPREIELFEDLLRDLQPDVVHFQHTLFLGYDLIGAAHRVLPDAPIVYTLHEYLPICHHDGQMLRTHDRKPCMEPTARDCSRCFPGISPDAFFLRQRFVQSQFALVDRFTAPSRFLRDRYVDWGLDPRRILVEECGRLDARRADDGDASRPRNTFGFFGQLTPFKGADVLLEAMKLLAERSSQARLRIHGANLERQRYIFRQKLQSLLDTAGGNVIQLGSYRRSEMPQLMSDVDWVVVPSIWWENAPLVIQEAFHHGRPVICSDIGGMAEKVTDNVDGLHFRAGDPHSLAETIERAMNTPGLWKRLRDNIKPVYSMSKHVAWLESLYNELLDAKAPTELLCEGSVR